MFERWKAAHEEAARLEAEAMKERLQASMLTRLKQEGWENVLNRVTKMTSIWCTLDWKKVQEPLLESDRSRLQPKLVSALEELKIQRLAQETKTRLHHALSAINIVRREYGRTHYIVPLSGDIFTLDPIQQAIFRVFKEFGDDNVDLALEKERLQDAVSEAATLHLDALTSEWILERSRELFSLLPQSSPSRSIDIANDMHSTLRLATTTFYLSSSNNWEPSTSVQAVTSYDASSRVRENDDSTQSSLSTLATAEKADRDRSLGFVINGDAMVTRTGQFVFFQGLVPVIEFMLLKCGHDPATATHSDLQGSSRIFRCKHQSCYNENVTLRDSNLLMATKMIAHWANHLKYTEATLGKFGVCGCS